MKSYDFFEGMKKLKRHFTGKKKGERERDRAGQIDKLNPEYWYAGQMPGNSPPKCKSILWVKGTFEPYNSKTERIMH